MAYDEELAERVRAMVGRASGMAEKRMFGGLAMMVNGNMAVVVRGAGGVMVRVDPAEFDRLLDEPGAEATEMRGRPMRGWVTLTPAICEQDTELRPWVKRGLTYARTLPAK